MSEYEEKIKLLHSNNNSETIDKITQLQDEIKEKEKIIKQLKTNNDNTNYSRNGENGDIKKQIEIIESNYLKDIV